MTLSLASAISPSAFTTPCENYAKPNKNAPIATAGESSMSLLLCPCKMKAKAIKEAIIIPIKAPFIAFSLPNKNKSLKQAVKQIVLWNDKTKRKAKNEC